MNNTGNLHSLWDTSMLTYRIRTSFESNNNAYYNYLHSKMLNLNLDTEVDNFTKWILESLDVVCKQVYFDEMNNTMNTSGVYRLNRIYYERNWPFVEERLIRAGFRLGALLNRILQNHTEPIKGENCTDSAVSNQFTVHKILFVFSILCYSINKRP